MIFVHELIDFYYPDERRFRVMGIPPQYRADDIFKLCQANCPDLKDIPKLQEEHPDNNLVAIQIKVHPIPPTTIWEIVVSYGKL